MSPVSTSGFHEESQLYIMLLISDKQMESDEMSQCSDNVYAEGGQQQTELDCWAALHLLITQSGFLPIQFKPFFCRAQNVLS